MKELSSTLAIVGVGLAGIYFLTTESDKKVLGAETFMASTGARAVRKSTIYYPMTHVKGSYGPVVVYGKAEPSLPLKSHVQTDSSFSAPIVDEVIKKLKKEGQIPNFTAYPGYPSYEEWLSYGSFDGKSKIHRYGHHPTWGNFRPPTIGNRNQNGYALYTHFSRFMPPLGKHYTGKDKGTWNQTIGNRIVKKTGTWKWPVFNWDYAIKQRKELLERYARGDFGPHESDSHGAFHYIDWSRPLNLKRWMELNPEIKGISFKRTRNGIRDVRYWKTASSPLTHNQSRNHEFYSLPDKATIDKQAKGALNFWTMMWKEGKNAQYLEEYTTAVQKQVALDMEKSAKWANMKVKGELHEFLIEKMTGSHFLSIPPAYASDAQKAWDEVSATKQKDLDDELAVLRERYNL